MTVTVSRQVTPDGASEAVADGLRAAFGPLIEAAKRRRRATLVSVVLPVAADDPLTLFTAARAMGQEPTLWLQPSQERALLGLGAAWTIEASGTQRFRCVEDDWTELSADALTDVAAAADAGADLRGCGPLILGGFGFADAPAREPTWRGFETARLVLPRLLVTFAPDGAWLTASDVVRPDAAEVERIDALIASWRALLSGSADLGATGPTVPATLDGRGSLRLAASRPGPDEWSASVARLAGAVGRGRLDKAVLARQVDLVAPSAIDVDAVLRRLRETAPATTVFAVCRGRRTFLGATPELLVSLRGRDFRSLAMAGSARRAADATTDALLAGELLASDKEREEHAVVVAMLREALAPLAERLAIPDRPQVLPLRHVQHLVTPVTGRLREPSGVLRLVELLHPTPAVGGAPRDLALELIAEEEGHERGWYAGPLGWLDWRGDGEFVVALRSGVIEDRVATLLAGCGIVADSDPHREWDESTAKLLALGSALGRVQP